MMLKGLLRDDGICEGYVFFGFMKIAWRYVGVAYDIHSLSFALSATGKGSRLFDDLVDQTRECILVWQNKKGRPHRHRPDHTRGTRYKRLHTILICPMIPDRSDLLLSLSLKIPTQSPLSPCTRVTKNEIQSRSSSLLPTDLSPRSSIIHSSAPKA
jgi:hypothetical protein